MDKGKGKGKAKGKGGGSLKVALSNLGFRLYALDFNLGFAAS